MTVIEWIRKAKCKDCVFLTAGYIGKRKRHVCRNAESPQHNSVRAKEDLVCDQWKLG